MSALFLANDVIRIRRINQSITTHVKNASILLFNRTAVFLGCWSLEVFGGFGVSAAPAAPDWPSAVVVPGAAAKELRRDFPSIANSFFQKSDSFAEWQHARDASYNVEMLGKVLQELSKDKAAFESRRDLLLKSQTPPRDIAWLKLYQEAYEALKKESLARVPKFAMIQRAPNSLAGTSAIMFSTRPRAKGSALCVYDPSQPGQAARRILELPEGYIFDVSASFDGKKLIFSKKEKLGDPYHIWEVNTDGTGLRQITSGNYHDVSPVYYPDGRIIFTSSRVESYSMCQNYLACALHICNGDGTNLRRFDFTTLSTLAPAVLPDGSIICTRWEYVDKNVYSWEGLWTINPNGRQLKLYYGNTLSVPNARYGAKPIPDDNKVVITMAAHHHPSVGDLAIIDRNKGVEVLEGFRQITFDTQYRAAVGKDWKDIRKWPAGDGFYAWSYANPYPISKDLILVAYGGGVAPEEGGPGQFRICLLTSEGVVFDLYREPGVSFCFPIPLAPRQLPATIPGEVPIESGEGTFFVQDIYEGLLSQGVQRGQVKELRVWKQIPKKYNTEGGRYLDQYPLVGYGTYYVKCNLGSVPVDENGSAYFKAPSNSELYFQALDKEGKEICRMGSVTQITTGETVSCIGCHENRLAAPNPPQAAAMHRLKSPPDTLRAPSWGAGNVDYVKQVQPVLDQYCVKCHSGPKPAGNMDLSGDKTRFFNFSYENLVHKKLVEYYWLARAPTGVFPALQTGSRVSRLTKMLEEKHQGVDVDLESRRRIYCWIDANVPYYGTWEMSRPHSTGGRDTWAGPNNRDLAPWVQKVIQEARLLNSIPATDAYLQDLGMSSDADKLHFEVNMTHPEWSRLLVANLARSAGGTAPDEKAAFKSVEDPRYKALLAAIQEGKHLLESTPRMDMPGGVSVPQVRDFGRTF